jgi:exodeoxyribonuclease V beta subunit
MHSTEFAAGFDFWTHHSAACAKGKNVLDLDLDRHAVIEASAGTGKTFMIEEIVCRILREERAKLDNIVLVTYTEKATNELKGRLRNRLEKALTQEVGLRPVFQDALDQFDQAHIFTIHGFCQRLREDFAFECGQDVGDSLVDDRELLHTLLREIMRKEWPKLFGSRLGEILQRIDFGSKSQGWSERILEMAAAFRPDCGHRLRPEPPSEWFRNIDGARPDLIAAWLEGHTVRRLIDLLARTKRERGLISYEDMLVRINDGLDPKRNPLADVFQQCIRARFRFALVDEFQDTDPLQWSIFKRAFVEGGASRLFVVGDPKQAIYGFRGADLPTYLKAVRELERDYGAARHALTTNWRSSPETIRDLNRLFQACDWFRNSGIFYHEVHPPVKESRNQIVHDASGRAALCLIDLRSKSKAAEARQAMAKFTAREIRRLLEPQNGQPLMSIRIGEEVRPLRPDDIGILIFKRADSDDLAHELQSLNIPHVLYSSRGLWQSDEALQLDYILRALSRPEHLSEFYKALLTDFFGLNVEQLETCADLPDDHRLHQIFQRWCHLAERRAWGALFESMLEDAGLTQRLTAMPGGERRLVNYRHLIARLEQEAYGANLDLLSLVERVKRWQSQKRDEDMPHDLEPNKVQILTVHAAKGLEFPVVFLIGGFTEAPQDKYLAYHDGDANMIFDLATGGSVKDGKERRNCEKAQEQSRLLYVALTRAMFKLYIPWTSVIRRKGGPTTIFLPPILEQAGFGGHCVIDAAQEMRRPPPGAPTPVHGRPELPPAVDLFPNLDPDMSRRRIVVRSFSSMHRHKRSLAEPEANYLELPPRAEDEQDRPVDDAPDPLRGPVFGDIVHAILEAVDFSLVGHAKAPADLLQPGHGFRLLLDEHLAAGLPRIRTRIDPAQVAPAARTQIAELIWNTLCTPLAAAGGPLCDVPACDRIHEVEFLFPQNSAALPPDVQVEDGFMTGYMDLVFRTRGRYFLVDWKSNLLDCYDAAGILRAMHEFDYIAQYELYVQALARWLGRVGGQAFDFARDFGGVYYLFLRGMNGRDESTGVFFTRNVS